MRTFVYAAVVSVAAAGLPHILQGQTAETKTAEQVYKNIQELKGTPADQLMPAMQFISAALGVECSFCHVQGNFAADDKRPKKTAREMMAMQASINQNSFRGQRVVTCYSCHRGAMNPVSTPPVMESDEARQPRPGAAQTPAAAAPTPDQVVEKYIAAVGGADALRKITSRIETGTIHAMGTDSPIEVLTKAPNMRMSITHIGNAQSTTAFDGTIGWLGSAGRPAHAMSPEEDWAASLDAEFYLPLRLKEIFPQLRSGRPEEINGKACNVINASSPGHPPVRLYFDAQSGLLVRMLRLADTPVGRLPTEIDYADYRDADGVQIPFRWTLARPSTRFTIQISEVKSNVPIADSRFAMPQGEVK
jgi:photosynthetic reaction center cytochrome c subunit